MDFRFRGLQRSLSSSSQLSTLSMDSTGARQILGTAPSIYGGAGGHGTRISTSKHLVNYETDPNTGNLFSGNEKMVMKNLNDRLASYLEKVQSLHQSNSKLEMQIKEWYEKNAPSAGQDFSAYYKQIQELQTQIKDAQLENAQWILKIDNARVAAEEFKQKYEAERRMCLSIQADVQSLPKVSDSLTLQKTDLEIQIEQLNQDLILLKKEHQEEVDILRKQLGNTVSVELKAAPGLNLSTIMDEMRQKYDVLAQENLKKVKEEFAKQTDTLQQEVTVNTAELRESEAQVTELRRTYQNLELDLKSRLSLKESLEQTVQDIEARYSSQLAHLQALLNTLGAQLMQIRTDTDSQNKKYNELFDIKTRLEQEIATYRRLLEGEDVRTADLQVDTLDETIDVKKMRKIKTVVEELVDGKVVSSKVKEVEETM